MLKGIGAVILGFVLVGALVFGLAVVVGLAQLPLMNINRAVIQHSQQYVQSHQEMLMSYYSDYVSGDAAHQAAARIQICTQAPQLLVDEQPVQIKTFVAENCQ